MISDEQIKVVYNTSAFEKAQDPRLRALLQYLSTATVTDEARPIADKVAAFKRLFPDGRPHMKYELDLYDKWREGRAEGIKEGIEQGLTQGRQEGIEKGEIIEGKPEVLASGLFGFTCSGLLYKLKTGKELDIQETYKEFSNYIVNGLKKS